jgi:hypothetical protein
VPPLPPGDISRSIPPLKPKASLYQILALRDCPLFRFCNGRRLYDDPKSQAFFQVLPHKRVSKPVNPIASSILMALSAQSSASYNPELDILLSSLESCAPSDLCLLSSPRASALHTAFESVFYDDFDPKSQKDIDRLPPAQAQRYNDASLTEFNGMKK